jgi:hypothetical protein
VGAKRRKSMPLNDENTPYATFEKVVAACRLTHVAGGLTDLHALRRR